MARNFSIVYDFGHRMPFINGGTAISEGDMVTLSSGALAEVANSNTVGAIGVACEDIAANATGWVYTAGIFKGQAASGTDFDHGDLVYNASANTLDAGSSGDIPVGRVVKTDPASGGTVYFALWSIAEAVPAAHS